MIRKTLNLYFLVLLLFISGCGFKPILVGSDYNFTIRVEESIGNTEINSRIENKLKKLEGINRTFNAIINSEEIKL